MTFQQWGGLVFFVAVFVVSFTLGRYFRRLDDRRAATEEGLKVEYLKVHKPDTVSDGKGHTMTTYDEKTLLEYMTNYYAELDRIVWEVHRRALIDGETAAHNWLRQETGRSSQSAP